MPFSKSFRLTLVGLLFPLLSFAGPDCEELFNSRYKAISQQIDEKEFGAAEKAIAAVLEESPQEYRYLNLLVRIRVIQKRLNEALALSQRCMDMAPLNSVCGPWHADLLFRTGKTQQAYDVAHALTNSTEFASFSRGAQIRTLDIYARVLFSLRRYSESEAVARQALERAPNDVYIMSHLAKALRHLNRDDEALEVVEQILERFPDDRIGLSMRQSILLHKRRTPESLAFQAREMLNRGRIQEAENLLRRTLTQNPNDNFALLVAVQLLFAQNRRGEAERALFTLAQRDLESAIASDVATLMVRIGRYDSALALLGRYRHTPRLWRDASFCIPALQALMSLKRFEEAVTLAQDVLPNPRRPDDFHRVQILLTRTLNVLTRYEEALSATNSVIAENPRNLAALFTQANSYYGLGRYRESRASLERIYGFKGDRARTPGELFLQARLEFQLGEVAKAKLTLTALLQLPQSNRGRIRTIAGLRRVLAPTDPLLLVLASQISLPEDLALLKEFETSDGWLSAAAYTEESPHYENSLWDGLGATAVDRAALRDVAAPYSQD